MKTDPKSQRAFVRPNGTTVIRQVGLRPSRTRDLYHSLRVASWGRVIGVISLVFLLSNLLFAFLYYAGGDVIGNARPGSFVDAYYFSVQTMATIGYGAMTPVGAWANALVITESLYSLLLTATATGVIYAKFSTPEPRVLYSDNVLIAPVKGVPTLMFRMANERKGHMIVEATVRVTFAREEREDHGGTRRRLFDLNLDRSVSPLFQLSWSVYHTIDQTSPLYGYDAERLAKESVGLIVTFSGIDDSLSQSVHSRHAYPFAQFIFGARFADILLHDEEGHRYIDYRKFHDVVHLNSTPQA